MYWRPQSVRILDSKFEHSQLVSTRPMCTCTKYQLFCLFYSVYVASTVTIGFETSNVTANEGDGSVTVNLVKTGDHSDNITVYINVMRVENSAIVKCMYMHNFIIIIHFYVYCISSPGD